MIYLMSIQLPAVTRYCSISPTPRNNYIID